MNKGTGAYAPLCDRVDRAVLNTRKVLKITIKRQAWIIFRRLPWVNLQLLCG